MAGLLDMFSSTDPQTQGLLGAIAGVYNASGPSLVPRSTGQVMGAGIAGLQQGQQFAQQQALGALKLQAMQGEIADQEKARQDALAAQDWYRKYNIGGQADATAPARAVLGNNMAPTVANAATLAAVPRSNATMDMFNRRMQQAQDMRASGIPSIVAQADALEKSALAFQPKVKDWKEVQQDGKVMYAPYFEDGSTGAPVPLEVAQKLQFQNVGGQTLALNPTTGAKVTSYTNTATPDELIADATQRRGQDITLRGQNLVDARAREANAIAGNKEKTPSEFQSKSAAYALRAAEADKILQALHDPQNIGVAAPDRPGAIKSMAEGVPLIGNSLGTTVNSLPTWLGGPNSSQQRAEQAQRDFVNAVMRNESGAAIAESEFENARKQYFPQAGDSAETIAQKARNRQLSIQGLQAGAGKNVLTPDAPTKTIVRTGIYGGRKVVQYSDGTTDYAN